MHPMKKKKTVLFDSEEYTTAPRIAEFLRELADRVESRSLVLRQGEREVSAQLPESLVLEISLDEKEKAGKGTKRSLEVEIEWYEGDGEDPVRLG